MTTCSTHVLDAALGVPAAGLEITLTGPDGSPVATQATDADGRIAWPDGLVAGTHVLHVGTGDWFAAAGRDTFYPSVQLTVDLGDGHSHVALLLSPYSYTTYRGS